MKDSLPSSRRPNTVRFGCGSVRPSNPGRHQNTFCVNPSALWGSPGHVPFTCSSVHSAAVPCQKLPVDEGFAGYGGGGLKGGLDGAVTGHAAGALSIEPALLVFSPDARPVCAAIIPPRINANGTAEGFFMIAALIVPRDDLPAQRSASAAGVAQR